MDTNMFRYAVAVAESGSISAAARKLFMSQPALTKQISKLESQLGLKLFERNRTPVVVTSDGAVFLEYAVKFIALEDEMRTMLEQGTESALKCVLVATTHRGGDYAGTHTAAFLERHRGIQIEYLDMSADECEAALLNEEVDLAIYTDPVLSDKIEYMPLEEDPLIFAVSRNSELLKGKDISGKSLKNILEIDAEEFRNANLTYLLSTPNHSLYHAENTFLKKYKVNPSRFLRVDYVDTRYSIACGGGGIVLIPHTTAKKVDNTEKVVYCTVKGEQMYRYVVIAKKKGKKLSKSADAVWRFMVGIRFEKA